ncbi:MAG: MgtC/SapB family protein [Chthoniobacteraceae bacterium]
MNTEVFKQLSVALALGLLVGVQRERTEHSVAGVRTFPLITLLGTVCALLAQSYGGWILAAGLAALAGIVIQANVARTKSGAIDPGITTEVAILLLYAVGALIVVQITAAVIIGGVVALLLQLKQEMHGIVSAIGERDVKAIMQFVLVTLVILPVLPNAEYGPYHVLNPFKIWSMVVLIVAISFCGYVAFKLVGAKKGTLVGGVLGGLVSSTATTVSFARTSRRTPTTAPLAATVILIASAVVFVRVLLLIAAVAQPSVTRLAPPLGVMLGAMLVLSAIAFFVTRKQQLQPPEPENPAELKAALLFGLIYAAVTLGIAAAREHFGQAGIYTVALLAGLTDMDAITISTSQLASAGKIESALAWRAILVAALSNIAFKTVLVAILGTRGLLWRVGGIFAIAVAAGAAIVWLWPA